MTKKTESAPDTEQIAALLAERHAVGPACAVSARAGGSPRKPELLVWAQRGSDRYQLDLRFEEGPADAEPWDLLVDAADALFGMLVEGEWSYRDLPVGEGVEFGGARFTVEVERTRPELDAEADRILAQAGD